MAIKRYLSGRGNGFKWLIHYYNDNVKQSRKFESDIYHADITNVKPLPWWLGFCQKPNYSHAGSGRMKVTLTDIQCLIKMLDTDTVNLKLNESRIR